MTLASSQVAPNRPMLAAKAGEHGMSQPPLLACMLDSEACEFIGFLHCYLLAGGSPCAWINHHGQRGPPIGKSRHDGGDAAGLQ